MKLLLGFVVGLVIAAAIAATALKVAWGDIADLESRDRGADVTKTVEVADFDAISITGVFEIDVTVGADYSVAISGKEDDLARTKVSVENGRLILDTANRDENGRRKVIKHGVTAKVTMPTLNAIDAAGVVDGDVRGINAESFTADVSGVGELNLAGSCGVFDADVSGVGELDAEALECRTVTVDVSGVGSAKVFASEAVEAEMAGIGKIEVYGSPATVSKSQSSPLGRISIR
ncbi:MAG: head GIN domain-containing protein [Parvularculaceae bacterium]